MEFDYKKLLIAYIQHVICQEGTAFLDDTFWDSITGLTKDEFEELNKLANQG
jgi:hypothetical protein